MLQDGDRVLVAVSGGVDSLVLACVLQTWQAKAPLSYTCRAVHIDNGFWEDQDNGHPLQDICEQLKQHRIDLQIESWNVSESRPESCYLCAKDRRNRLFEIARDRGYNKIAFGHHKDDLIETFMLNTLYSGNISTMLPKQELFNGGLSLIRPMAYLEKEDISQLAAFFSLSPKANSCPYSTTTKRQQVREILADIDQRIPGARNSIFAALSNIRTEYLLKKRVRKKVRTRP
ncbi:MAG: tRNA 2-thiocytidine(32) synthetase TtcA [Deltaproteobacteria bacterium]|nr:MAG: tRNA 2-thiocytidine(32) synthetase TtcA [Deltaproteobacteria bacterium]PIE73391.1 MAG: tRNA 2-thiocytidine(32) synthetase TtcA [Deltaproteobacteria bacterium]